MAFRTEMMKPFSLHDAIIDNTFSRFWPDAAACMQLVSLQSERLSNLLFFCYISKQNSYAWLEQNFSYYFNFLIVSLLCFFFFPADVLGAPTDLHSPDSLNCILPSDVANKALKRALNTQEPEDSLTEEDLALAASLEYLKTIRSYKLNSTKKKSCIYYHLDSLL